MKKILIAIMMVLVFVQGYGDRVKKIIETKVLKVGMTGDYKPFSYIENGEYKGYDVEVAKLIAQELGVELEIVSTTWKDMLKDLKNDSYDIAMGGITRTIKRQKEVEMTKPYLIIGKCFLIRKEDENIYNSIENINNSNVRLGVNIGGTNEIYVDNCLTKANVIKYKNNLEVPEALLNRDIDVMMTETIEAILYEKNNSKLKGVLVDSPLTKSQMGYMVQKNEVHLLNTVNFILEELEVRGKIEELKVKYLK